MTDTEFIITLENFEEGASPLAHIDSYTFKGGAGQHSSAKCDLISEPNYIQQSPALVNLTNGSQAGVVDQLIRFILDKPTDTDITYAVGTSKLFKLSSTAVTSGGSPSWPQAITNMTSGESIVRLGDNLYVFYNKSSGGDIAKMVLSTESITVAWGSAADEALQSAIHPVAVKEDVMIFGNGRYVGTYIDGGTLKVDKLDFKSGATVADIAFFANVWYIAVNYGEGRRGQVYLYDGSTISTILSDEVGIGAQEIGFLYVLNGIVYVAYRDNSTGYYAIGWLSGRQLKPLRYFSGTLPDHRQKTLYKNTILFLSNADLWSCGATVDQLPIQISKLADAGYATVGGLATPFGTPMVASTDGGSNYRIAKFSGYSVDSNWYSISLDVTKARNYGRIHTVIVTTKPITGSSAKAEITLLGNQNKVTTMTALSVTGENKTKHVFRTIDLEPVEDLIVKVDYTNGDTTNTVKIRKIELLGNNVER
jgi:hypothetical protein